MVRGRFGRVNADCNVSGIPEGRPLFLSVLVGNGCGALQPFLISHVMSECRIRIGVSGWLAAKQTFESVSTVLDVPVTRKGVWYAILLAKGSCLQGL